MLTEILKALFSSKKFLVALAGALLAATNHVGLHLQPDSINWVLTLAGAYIVGQGVADNGKEAAKIMASVPKPAGLESSTPKAAP